eukprot:CAMPEP_0170548134 /NCGR_PEP_ID=MMETSP0211-20121228/6464_1 /TAXON_ID=311385 /ORGANISM="Pseudokeronopsis sp., Strain OXSARD2" /LENGTH=39 /DNA_ID= /DNA_START= /DNA_END= /DNA_ORIENTATION=
MQANDLKSKENICPNYFSFKDEAESAYRQDPAKSFKDSI